MNFSSSSRKRTHWLLENPPETARSDATLSWEPLRLHFDNADDDAVADALVEMRGDVEVWKGFKNRIKGLKMARDNANRKLPEKIEKIIQQQLQCTKENIEKVEEMVQRQRRITLIPSQTRRVPNSARLPAPIRGCPKSPLSRATEPEDNIGCSSFRIAKRIRYSSYPLENDAYVHGRVSSIDGRSSDTSGSTPKIEKTEAFKGTYNNFQNYEDGTKESFFPTRIAKSLFGFVSRILTRDKNESEDFSSHSSSSSDNIIIDDLDVDSSTEDEQENIKNNKIQGQGQKYDEEYEDVDDYEEEVDDKNEDGDDQDDSEGDCSESENEDSESEDDDESETQKKEDQYGAPVKKNIHLSSSALTPDYVLQGSS